MTYSAPAFTGIVADGPTFFSRQMLASDVRPCYLGRPQKHIYIHKTNHLSAYLILHVKMKLKVKSYILFYLMMSSVC